MKFRMKGQLRQLFQLSPRSSKIIYILFNNRSVRHGSRRSRECDRTAKSQNLGIFGPAACENSSPRIIVQTGYTNAISECLSSFARSAVYPVGRYCHYSLEAVYIHAIRLMHSFSLFARPFEDRD